MIHGKKDYVVPIKLSRLLLSTFYRAKKKTSYNKRWGS